MGGAQHHVNHLRADPDHFGQRSDHIFDTLARRNQAEGQRHGFAFHTELVLVKVRIDKGHVRDAVRNEVDFLRWHPIIFAQQTMRPPRHHDHAGGESGDLLQNAALFGIRLFQDGVKGCHQGDLQLAQQRQNVSARESAEDAIFVLQADHLGLAEVQKVRRALIRFEVLLDEFEAHLLRVVVAFRNVADRNHRHTAEGVIAGVQGCQHC